MLQFLHPNTFWLFPAFLQNSVLPRLGFASKYMKDNLDIFVLCKRNESELRKNWAKFANFGEQIENFRFRRKFGEISAHVLF